MNGLNMRFQGEIHSEEDFYVIDALQSINRNLSVINERLEKVLSSEFPVRLRPYIDDSLVAEAEAQQMLLRLILRCLRDFPENRN